MVIANIPHPGLDFLRKPQVPAPPRPLPESGGDGFARLNSPEFKAQLLAGGRIGQRAFRKMVSLTRPMLARFVGRTLSSPSAVEETVQDIYQGIYLALPGFRGSSKLTTWIYGLARHKICDKLSELRRRRLEREILVMACRDGEWEPSGNLSKATAWESAPDRILLRITLEDLIAKALAEIPAEAREVYRLRDLEGMTGEETATALGLNETNVRVRLHRARAQIAEKVRLMMA